MIIEPSNYTYETMPDYTDAVDGAVEIPVTGEEIEMRMKLSTTRRTIFIWKFSHHSRWRTRSALGRASHLFRDPPG